ncbi:MAG: DegV family protein [Bacilli bacterium]|nr:DegV family protein [Bacilli bacterium]MBR6866277.1 DegV family protein [Bacilli bacterium]
MEKIVISSESSLDLKKDEAAKYHIHVIPYTLLFGDECALDGEYGAKDIFAYTKRTGKLAKTSAINAEEYKRRFTELLKDHDYLIHFSIGAKISSTYEHALQAASEFEGKVHIVNTMNLSGGIALQAIYARELIEQGKSFKEVCDEIDRRAPYMHGSFALESVDYLYKGGRCNALAMLGANLLKLRPQILLADGKMVCGKKFRGKKEKWVFDYLEETLSANKNPDLTRVFVAYTEIDKELLDKAYNRLKEFGFKEIIVHEAQGTVSCHAGPGTFGIFFYNNK